EAILLPAEAVGLDLRMELVERLVTDTAHAPGVLPLLQHALYTLVELLKQRQAGCLTLETYEEINGVKGPLTHHANSIVNSLSDEQQKIAWRIFLRLVQLGEGTTDTRRRTTFNELLTQDSTAAQVEEVVNKLTQANLIVSDRLETGE